ncbi:MAG: protease inhibitor I42 family protein [Chloroflexi bacterium]|nr:protease inhibitor I42 family protein [Chloroflexota bacterium]
MKKKRKILYNLFIGLFFLTGALLFSCSKENEAQLINTPSIPVFTPTSATTSEENAFFPPEIDLVVELNNAHQRVVEIEKGQIFQIKKPGLANEWQVGFDPELFELLTPPEMMRSPGKDGWVFRAVLQGQGSLVFTSIVSCDGPEPCPMMPARLELNVEVQ